MKLRSKTFDFKSCFHVPWLRGNYMGIAHERSGPSYISLILNISRMFCCCFCENSLIVYQERCHSTCSSVVEFYTAGLMTDGEKC